MKFKGWYSQTPWWGTVPPPTYEWDEDYKPMVSDVMFTYPESEPITKKDVKKASARRRNQMLMDFVYYVLYFILYCMVTAMFLSVLV